MFPSPQLIWLFVKQGGSWLIANWRTGVHILLVLFVVCFTYYVVKLQNELRIESERVVQYQKLATDNANAIKKAADNANQIISAIVAERDSAVARVTAAQERERSILNEPDYDDGLVAPTLRRSLERLQR